MIFRSFFELWGYFDHFFFQGVFQSFFIRDILVFFWVLCDILVIFWVSGVFWSFCRFWGYFVLFFWVLGIAWSFFMFKGYFGHFSGFWVF